MMQIQRQIVQKLCIYLEKNLQRTVLVLWIWVKLSKIQSILCLKKVSTLKLFVTLSNLNRFSKCLHCWKAHKICYKTHTTLSTSPKAQNYKECKGGNFSRHSVEWSQTTLQFLFAHVLSQSQNKHKAISQSPAVTWTIAKSFKHNVYFNYCDTIWGNSWKMQVWSSAADDSLQ